MVHKLWATTGVPSCNCGMEARRRLGRRGLAVVGIGTGAVAAAIVGLPHLTSPPHDDCAVAADVVSTWRAMTASVDQLLDGHGDQLMTAAFTESATADQLRTKARGVASARIRADVIGLADALERIAGSHRAAIASHTVPGASPDPQYLKGSQDAVAAATALRMACPSISADRGGPPAPA